MTVETITPKQVEALRLIAAGKVLMKAPDFRIRGANPTVVGRLTSIGLAVWPKVGAQTCEITEAGRLALGKPPARRLCEEGSHGRCAPCEQIGPHYCPKEPRHD